MTLTLFDVEPQRDSSPEKRAADCRLVLAWFMDHTGTPYDCAKALRMLYTTALPRCTDLKHTGLLVKIPGIPRKETGLGGTSATLIITKAGREAYTSGKPLPRPPKKKRAA